jgi:hypothetical protein
MDYGAVNHQLVIMKVFANKSSGKWNIPYPNGKRYERKKE